MSIKVSPGQLEFWQLSADLSRFDKSDTAQALRDYVSQVAKTQAFAPDVVPDHVETSPMVDADTGKLVQFKT